MVERAHSDGVPGLIAPAHAAPCSGQRLDFIDHDKDKAVWVLYHRSDGGKQLLHELARLGEPLGEERVRVDLY